MVVNVLNEEVVNVVVVGLRMILREGSILFFIEKDGEWLSEI
jgi:hypothetical protein